MLRLQEPYQARPIRFLEVWGPAGWRLKVYGIRYQGGLPRPELVHAARGVTEAHIGRLSAGIDHYSVGFLGIHDGRGANFVFLDFWANENELYHHVFVSPTDKPEQLDYVTPSGLTACVWDLRVLCFERQAWVDAVLNNPEGPDLERYLAYRLSEEV